MTAADHTPSPTTDGLREVLAAHRYRDVLGDYEIKPYRKHFGCSCGWQQDIGGMSGYWSWVAAHETHVAEQLLAAHPAPPSETAPALDGPSFGDYWPPSEAATEDESVRRYLDRVESVTTNESVLSVIREIRGELAASSVEETQP